MWSSSFAGALPITLGALRSVWKRDLLSHGVKTSAATTGGSSSGAAEASGPVGPDSPQPRRNCGHGHDKSVQIVTSAKCGVTRPRPLNDDRTDRMLYKS